MPEESVLVVDDHPLTREALAALLVRRGEVFVEGRVDAVRARGASVEPLDLVGYLADKHVGVDPHVRIRAGPAR